MRVVFSPLQSYQVEKTTSHLGGLFFGEAGENSPSPCICTRPQNDILEKGKREKPPPPQKKGDLRLVKPSPPPLRRGGNFPCSHSWRGSAGKTVTTLDPFHSYIFFLFPPSTKIMTVLLLANPLAGRTRSSALKSRSFGFI